MNHHTPLPFTPLTPDQMLARAQELEQSLQQRRSVRAFSDQPVPRALIEAAIRAASSAPSGAHRQPWTFAVVSSPDLKRQIRAAAEAEERESYLGGRMPPEWREALEPLGTDWQKPFLEIAPWLVIVFQHTHGVDECGERFTNYYVKESVGIACGFFIAALHHMGLVTLTHTPSPMGFLSELLQRPPHEKPFILFPVGFPAPDATVPELVRKPLHRVSAWYEDDSPDQR
jgi:iodotyrosine deiodinase